MRPPRLLLPRYRNAAFTRQQARLRPRCRLKAAFRGQCPKMRPASGVTKVKVCRGLDFCLNKSIV